ncbi:hypothetical protein GGI42DRAFT_180130 [Trichoderma sp. SZMC 28013]
MEVESRSPKKALYLLGRVLRLGFSIQLLFGILPRGHISREPCRNNLLRFSIQLPFRDNNVFGGGRGGWGSSAESAYECALPLKVAMGTRVMVKRYGLGDMTLIDVIEQRNFSFVVASGDRVLEKYWSQELPGPFRYPFGDEHS